MIITIEVDALAAEHLRTAKITERELREVLEDALLAHVRTATTQRASETAMAVRRAIQIRLT